MDEVAAEFGPFEIEYEGLGVFPGASNPKTVWAGCAYQATLELMQHELVSRLSALGFEPEGRRFNPHVTLGRVRRNTGSGELRGLLQSLETTTLRVSDYVEALDLMLSERTSGGSKYRSIHRSKLGAS